MDHVKAESNAGRIVAWLRERGTPASAEEIIAGTGIAKASVSATLSRGRGNLFHSPTRGQWALAQWPRPKGKPVEAKMGLELEPRIFDYLRRRCDRDDQPMLVEIVKAVGLDPSSNIDRVTVSKVLHDAMSEGKTETYHKGEGLRKRKVWAVCREDAVPVWGLSAERTTANEGG